MSVNGCDLKAGQTIAVCWRHKQATVIGFKPHDSGRDGWRVAQFGNGLSMTITPYDRFKVIA